MNDKELMVSLLRDEYPGYSAKQLDLMAEAWLRAEAEGMIERQIEPLTGRVFCKSKLFKPN